MEIGISGMQSISVCTLKAPPAAAEGVNMPIPIVIGLRFVFRDAYNYPNPDSNKY